MSNLKDYLSGTGWEECFEEYLKRPKSSRLVSHLKRINGIECCPRKNQIFRAFKETSFDSVKVVILGQDPYSTPGAANGLAFGTSENKKRPPSLRNILREVEYSCKVDIPSNESTLVGWAKQGVLLLNSSLTVSPGKTNDHADVWEDFTDHVLQYINNKKKCVVFVLLGSEARSKRELVTSRQNIILEAAHPSPLSANNGFFGCNHFVTINEFFKEFGISEIDWSRVDDKRHSEFLSILIENRCE